MRNVASIDQTSVATPLTRTLPLVTAIIATYNRANLVGNAIESIFGQTYEHIEIIVVDDGSTDDTQKVLERLGNRIRVIWQENAGPSSARNRGIATAKGEIIAFLDSDDLWLPMKIERQVELLMEVDESVPCCVCDAEMHFTNRKPSSSFQNFLLKPSVDEGLWSNPTEVLTDRFVLFNQMAAIRRSALEKVGGFNPQLRFLEDYDLALRLSLLGPFAFVREPLVIWNQGSNGSLSEEAHRHAARLKEIEAKIRQRVLNELRTDVTREDTAKQMKAALAKCRRQMWIARMRETGLWAPSALGYVASRLDRYADAAVRRSRWFIEMKTTPFKRSSYT